MKWFLFSFTIFISTICFSQKFKKFKNDKLNERVVEFVDERNPAIIPIIIKKISPIDSTGNKKIRYDIGIFTNLKSIPVDLFMEEVAIINFTDGSHLKIEEKIHTTYLYSGTHQAHIKHTLLESEFNLLQREKIKSIIFVGYEIKIDKWEQENLLKAFQDIIKE